MIAPLLLNRQIAGSGYTKLLLIYSQVSDRANAADVHPLTRGNQRDPRGERGIMKIAATLFAVFLWLLGAVFLLAAAHPDAVAQGKSVPRLFVGGLLVLGGALLAYLAWRTPRRTGSAGGGGMQEPPGPLSLKALTCPHCGGQVDPASAALNAEGTLSVTCSYCKGTFLVQEDPKW